MSDLATSETKDSTDSEFQRLSFQSTMSDLATSETKDSTGIYVGQTFYIGLFTTGFAVLCLSVGCNYFINKYRVTIAKRKERSSDDNDHQEDVLHADGTNNTTVNEIAAEENNENEVSHYEMINENEMIEMFHPTSSQHLSNLPRASNIVQTLQSDNMYLEVIEDTNIQKLDPRTKMNRDEDQVSILKGSQREEKTLQYLYFQQRTRKIAQVTQFTKNL
ncbi:unnamed protein product [Mytilus edulis]|uniref:Uncharacterized protein n=1 Tax=Mytilus edulis TaxID=6550 RepID=A0A8S3TG20_MYTED|nr:unnamed protein product [Mytilus edulis]